MQLVRRSRRLAEPRSYRSDDRRHQRAEPKAQPGEAAERSTTRLGNARYAANTGSAPLRQMYRVNITAMAPGGSTSEIESKLYTFDAADAGC